MGDNRIMNPQRQIFKEAYCNPESDTFGNAYQSAIKAGYEEGYAKTILNQGQEWVKELIRDQEMTEQAEKNLKIFLTDCDDDKIKADITKWYLARIKKNKYSDRQELTGANGEKLETIVAFNYLKPNEKDNPDNQANTETAPSVGETT